MACLTLGRGENLGTVLDNGLGLLDLIRKIQADVIHHLPYLFCIDHAPSPAQRKIPGTVQKFIQHIQNFFDIHIKASFPSFAISALPRRATTSSWIARGTRSLMSPPNVATFFTKLELRY